MDALLEKLETKMLEWNRPSLFLVRFRRVPERDHTIKGHVSEIAPETAEDVRQRVAEIIELADENALDLSRSRVVEQDVLDLLDKPTSR